MLWLKSDRLNFDLSLTAVPVSFFTPLNRSSSSHISPVIGLAVDGPTAMPEPGCIIHLTVLYLISAGSQSASSGICFATIAFLKPIFSKDLFQPNIPSLKALRNCKGTVFSIQNTIGSFGSDNLALGFFFSNFHLWTYLTYGDSDNIFE